MIANIANFWNLKINIKLNCIMDFLNALKDIIFEVVTIESYELDYLKKN